MLQEESFFLSRVCIAAALALIAACPACMQPWTATAAALSAEMMISTVLRSLGRQGQRRKADDLSIHQSLTNNGSLISFSNIKKMCPLLIPSTFDTRVQNTPKLAGLGAPRATLWLCIQDVRSTTINGQAPSQQRRHPCVRMCRPKK